LVKIAVLGAGARGYTFAADLTLLGHTVHLYELPEFAKELDPVKKHGGIELLAKDPVWGPPDELMGPERSGFAKIDLVTTDIEKAVKDVDVVINPVPAMGHEPFARAVTPHLRDSQSVFLSGKGGGTLIYSMVMKELDLKPDVILGETFGGYATTRMGRILGEVYDNKVRIEGPSRGGFIGSFPAKNTKKACDILTSLYPRGTRRYIPAKNVLHTMLFDPNHFTHPAFMVCNAARIETGDPTFHMFGKDASTPSVCRIMDGIDDECSRIAEAVCLKNYIPRQKRRPPPWHPFARDTYERIHTWFLEVCEGPFTLKSRYLVEDLKYGLRIVSSLGDMFKVPTPVSDAIITIGSILVEEDFWKTGRTVEKLGIDPAWNLKQLEKYLEEGKL
jgi:opine dehydrogenase